MSKKLQGNGLFESSRMILPEHAERIRQQYIEEKRKENLILDDQELRLIEQALVDSYNQRQPVTLKVFGPFEDFVLKGTVIALNTSRREVKLLNANGDYQWIELGEILAAYE
ncbi:YolD-like family protein [Paenibacillus massiliensis]|uniref:YolD-like family protein n=1 Tax=Paenibacillus massiliensis TaxID=225917 RepID=UPI00035ECEF1|nr:YolD-like family protein [Paenibacillus massiliensis]